MKKILLILALMTGSGAQAHAGMVPPYMLYGNFLTYFYETAPTMPSLPYMNDVFFQMFGAAGIDQQNMVLKGIVFGECAVLAAFIMGDIVRNAWSKLYPRNCNELYTSIIMREAQRIKDESL